MATDELLLRSPAARPAVGLKLLTVGLELLDLVLLFRGQQGEDVRTQVRLENGRFGFRRDEIRGGRANGAFVDRARLNRCTARVHRGAQALLDLLTALPALLRQIADLLTLAVGEIQLRERQPEVTTCAESTASPTPAGTTGPAARALGERGAAPQQARDDHAGNHVTKSSHHNLH